MTKLMNKNEWCSYLRFDEVPDSGTFICQPTDAVLDPEFWPIWAVIMVDGVIIHQENLYAPINSVYKSTDMHGWTKVQLVAWIQAYDLVNTPEEETNNIMWLGNPNGSRPAPTTPPSPSDKILLKTQLIHLTQGDVDVLDGSLSRAVRIDAHENAEVKRLYRIWKEL